MSAVNKRTNWNAGRLAVTALICAAIGGFEPNAGALTINPIFDSTITSDSNAGAIETTIRAMCFEYRYRIADPGVVNITFLEKTSGLGSSYTGGNEGVNVSYMDYVKALRAHASSAVDTLVTNNLALTVNNPVNGSQTIYLQYALARTLGLTTKAPASDNTIELNTGSCRISESDDYGYDFSCFCYTKYSLCPVICHEMDECLGFGSALNGKDNGDAAPTGAIQPEDLWRYDQNNARSFTTDVNAQAYFYVPGLGGVGRFNQTEGGDFGDWYGDGIPRVQNATGTRDADPRLGDFEMAIFDIIGYHMMPTPMWFDPTEDSGGNGAYYSAFNKEADAGKATLSGGAILIKNAHTFHHSRIDSSTFSRPVKLVSFDGTRIVP